MNTNPTNEHSEQALESKLTFFEWYAERECREDETPHTGWIENFVRSHVWESYSNGKAIHDGDCTNMPYTCNLCALEDLLAEYREYRLGPSSRDAEIREVLEGLMTLAGDYPCWCAPMSEPHDDACLAARALYATLQPKESSDVT